MYFIVFLLQGTVVYNSILLLLCTGRKALYQAAAMDEMDLPQMKKEVESLKYQLAFKREKSSKTVTEWVVHLQ